MTEAVHDYFKAQKKDSIYFMALGFVSLALAIFFLSKANAYFNGMAYVLLASGFVELISGMTVYARCEMDRISVSYFIQKDFELIQQREIPRMELLIKEYAIFWKAEVGCIVLGLVLWMLCGPMSLGKGIGLALIVQALVLLVFDYMSLQRGANYLNFLQSLKPQS